MLKVREERTGTPPSENTPVRGFIRKKKNQEASSGHRRHPGTWLSPDQAGSLGTHSVEPQETETGIVWPADLDTVGPAWPEPRLVAWPGTAAIMPQAPAPGPRHLPQIRFSFLITAVMGPSDLIPALDII